MKTVKDYQKEAREKLLTAGVDGFTIDLDVEALDTLIATICEEVREEERERIGKNISKLQRWADTDGGEAGMRAEIDGGWLDEDDVLEALNPN